MSSFQILIKSSFVIFVDKKASFDFCIYSLKVILLPSNSIITSSSIDTGIPFILILDI